MSNSSLVSYTKISPNKTSPRNHAIDTITIHCVVGQCSVETLGNVFAPTSRQASSNYGVGVDGRIGMYVEEKDRSWCSSNGANDNRAVTIEVASDNHHPYAVNAKAYAAMLDLVTDICKRNGIKMLVWSTNKNERVNHLFCQGLRYRYCGFTDFILVRIFHILRIMRRNFHPRNTKPMPRRTMAIPQQCHG